MSCELGSRIGVGPLSDPPLSGGLRYSQRIKSVAVHVLSHGSQLSLQGPELDLIAPQLFSDSSRLDPPC